MCCDSQMLAMEEYLNATHAPSRMAAISTTCLTNPFEMPDTMAGMKHIRSIISTIAMFQNCIIKYIFLNLQFNKKYTERKNR